MDKDSTTVSHAEDLFAGDAWFDPIEAGIRDRIRGFIEVMLEEELAAVLGGGRYERGHGKGHRHGKRSRHLLGSFGPTTISVPRAIWRAPTHGVCGACSAHCSGVELARTWSAVHGGG